MIRGRMFLRDEDKLRPLSVKTRTPHKVTQDGVDDEEAEGEAEEVEVEVEAEEEISDIEEEDEVCGL